MKMNQYDKNNVALFNKGVDNKFLCSMCGQYTTFNDSASNRGYNLVCNRCCYKIAGLLNCTYGDVVIKIQKKGVLKCNEQTNIDND